MNDFLLDKSIPLLKISELLSLIMRNYLDSFIINDSIYQISYRHYDEDNVLFLDVITDDDREMQLVIELLMPYNLSDDIHLYLEKMHIACSLKIGNVLLVKKGECSVSNKQMETRNFTSNYFYDFLQSLSNKIYFSTSDYAYNLTNSSFNFADKKVRKLEDNYSITFSGKYTMLLSKDLHDILDINGNKFPSYEDMKDYNANSLLNDLQVDIFKKGQNLSLDEVSDIFNGSGKYDFFTKEMTYKTLINYYDNNFIKHRQIIYDYFNSFNNLKNYCFTDNDLNNIISLIGKKHDSKKMILKSKDNF